MLQVIGSSATNKRHQPLKANTADKLGGKHSWNIRDATQVSCLLYEAQHKIYQRLFTGCYYTIDFDSEQPIGQRVLSSFASCRLALALSTSHHCLQVCPACNVSQTPHASHAFCDIYRDSMIHALPSFVSLPRSFQLLAKIRILCQSLPFMRFSTPTLALQGVSEFTARSPDSQRTSQRPRMLLLCTRRFWSTTLRVAGTRLVA